jgi:1-acyl-sn-glycerol-3-phosphate acyltransferase
MEDWKHAPARDLELSGLEKHSSHHRENGLIASAARLAWGIYTRTVLYTYNRLTIEGMQHLPAKPPFMVVANHSSHLDAILLSNVIPLRWRNVHFPIAAKDVFFENEAVATFAATVLNAMPVDRKALCRRGLGDLKERLIRDQCIFTLFPEGTRARDGQMGNFKPGIGMLVAGADVPVVPCYIDGAHAAMPPNSWFLRPKKITIRVGPPKNFASLGNNREGWETCAKELEDSVRALALR